MNTNNTLTPIGIIQTREIQYVSIVENPDWAKCLPKQKWLALVINHECEDETLFNVVSQCQKNKKLIELKAYQSKKDFECCMEEDFIATEIENRASNAKQLAIFLSLMGVSRYHNLDYGLYYISKIAGVDFLATYTDAYKVVCIDCNIVSSKERLEEFLLKINTKNYMPRED